MKRRSTVLSCVSLVLATVCLVLMPASSNAQGSLFVPAGTYAVGAQPFSVFSADLDGDNDKDLAVAGCDFFAGYGCVSILLNNSDGTFTAAVNYVTGNSPFSVFTSDHEGEGKY